jgi:hypothetical protein
MRKKERVAVAARGRPKRPRDNRRGHAQSFACPLPRLNGYLTSIIGSLGPCRGTNPLIMAANRVEGLGAYILKSCQNGVTTYKYASFECLVMISAGQEDIKRVGSTKKGVVTARVTPNFWPNAADLA